MKQKLLLTLLALFTLIGGVNLYAQTDVTSTYITNASFESNGNQGSTMIPTGWTLAFSDGGYTSYRPINATTTPNGSLAVSNGTRAGAADGDCYLYLRTNWGSGAINITQATQTLPAGHYVLKSDLLQPYSTTGMPTLTINVKNGDTELASVSITRQAPIWKTFSLEFDLDAEASVTIGINHATGTGNSTGCLSLIDNFRLYQYNYSSLQTLITDAEALYNVDFTDAAIFLTAINTAKGIAATDALSTITSGITSLENAIESYKVAQFVVPSDNNYTSWITNANLNTATGGTVFASQGTVWNSNIPSGWNVARNSGSGMNTTTVNDGQDNKGFETWTGDKAAFMTLYQSISSLPAGKYTCSAYLRNAGKLFVENGTNEPIYSDANTNTNWTQYSVSFVKKSADDAVLVGIVPTERTDDFFAQVDEFTLTCDGLDLTALKAQLIALQNTANDLLGNTVYDNVVGEERTILTTKNNATPEATIDGYTTAINELQRAIDVFTAAKPNYDALVAEIAYAKTIGVDERTADEFAATNQSTAETVVVNTQNLKVAEYTHITETYTEDATLGTWTEDFAEDLNGEGYVANGPKYWNEWGTNTRTAKQTVSLPAGDYAIACIARGQVGTSGHMYYKIGTDETTVDFIMKGNRGRGVDTSKDANFSDGGTYTCNNEGFGWEYRYLTFTLAQQTDVEIGVSATFAGQWVSIYAPELLTTETSVKALRLAEIAEAINNVPTGNMYSVVRTTLNDKKAAAEAASTSNTKDELTTILNELNDAIAAATASIAEYDEISDYLTTSQTNVAGDYTSINTAITNGDYEHEADGIAAVKAIRNSIATNNMAANTDLTVLIDNNDFELGDTKYWTVVNSSDTGVRETTNDTYRMSNSHGNYLFNTWWQGTPITQNIGKLPAGAYEMKGVVASDGGTIYITMNDSHEAFVETAGAKSGSSIAPAKVGIEFSYVFTLDAETDVTIGIVGGADGTAGSHKAYQDGGYWFYKADNFRLTYLGVTAPENILDGNHYYLKTNGYSIGRGGDSNTEAVMVSDGIPVMISTNKAGISTIKFKDNEKFMMYNDEMVYTDGTIDPKSTYHKPYWKIIAVSDGYNILNTESGLYLTTTTANRNGSDIMVVTLSETAAIWTLTDATLDVAKADLQNAIDQAPKAATSNVGTAAFQLPTDGVNTYSDALATAQAAHDDGDATLTSIAAAKADLEAAIKGYNTLEVNAPADGQLFNVVLTYDGWTYDNKAMTYIANGRTNAGNYNIQYKEEANKNLAQAFTFTKVEGNKYKMSQIDADGVARYISTGVPYGGNTGQIRTTTNADNALAVEVIPTATEGVWNLRNTAANNYIGSQDAGVFTVNSHIDFKLVETTKPSITINTTAAGWGTTILPFAVASIPEGVRVYSCPAVNGTALNLTQVDALEANKPYIIEGAWEATLTGNAQGIALNYTEGLLTGTYERILAPNGSYVLQKQGDKVAFFQVDTSFAQPYVPANRAYLNAPAGTEAKMFTFGGDATGISALDALLNGDAEIFNVSGVKQNSLQKGLNIIKMSDGTTHKVMVK